MQCPDCCHGDDVGLVFVAMTTTMIPMLLLLLLFLMLIRMMMMMMMTTGVAMQDICPASRCLQAHLLQYHLSSGNPEGSLKVEQKHIKSSRTL